MIEINNTTKAKIDLILVKKTAQSFLKNFKKEKYGVSIAFVSDEEIKKLNNHYRGKNKPTDVLSFEGEGDFLGEILLSYSQIKKQAKEFDKNIKEELLFVLVHGLLHLLGYRDATEKGRQEMIKIGEKFIKNFSNNK